MNRNKNALYLSLGLGAAAVTLGLVRPKRNRHVKKAVKNVERIADAVCEVMGW